MRNRLTMLVVAALVATVTGASAATLEVGPGRTYTTIQSAIDAANGGDTIFIYAGEYNESLYLANFDADGDHYYDGPSDKDYSGLTIVGEDRDTVIINPNPGGIPDLDKIRNPTVGVYAYDPFTWESFDQLGGLIIDSQDQWDGNPANYVSQVKPNADQSSSGGFNGNTYLAYPRHAAVTAPAEPGFLEDITVRNLTIRNAETGLALRGAIRGALVDNVKIEDCFTGFNTFSVQGVDLFNSEIRNNKFAVYIGSGSQNVQMVDNLVAMDNDVPAPWNQHGSDHRAIRILNYDREDNANHPFRRVDGNDTRNIEFTRNVVDYSAYTEGRHTIGVELSGGSDVTITNNVIKGFSKAFWVYWIGWFGLATDYNINGNTISEYFNGMDLSPMTNTNISRNDFTDVVSSAAVPWVESGAPTYLHAAPDPARGNQIIQREFEVPLSGNTTLSFDHWFSITGHIYLEIAEETSPGVFSAWTPLYQSLYDENSGSVVRQYWGPTLLSDESGKGPYEPDCSGWFQTGVPIPNTSLTFDAPYNGLTTDGILSESYDLTANGYNGKTVRLRFRQFGATYGEKGCYGCTIDGSSDWAGWYIQNFLVSNDGSGTVDDVNAKPLSGSVIADWDQVSEGASYSIALGNKSRDHKSTLPSYLDGDLGGYTISQNIFSNVNGDGVVIRHDTANESDPRIINDNEFFGNGQYALSLYNSVNSASEVTQDINAENNWWGDNSGPLQATSNPSGLGDEIFDPNDLVDFTPFTSGLSTNQITDARFGAGIGNRGDCGAFDINFYSVAGNSKELLGTLACGAGGYTDAGPTTNTGFVLVEIVGSGQPSFQVGDFLEIDIAGDTFEVFLQPNVGGLYGTGIRFWATSDGSTYFAGDATNRNADVGDGGFQDLSTARNDLDFAQDVGFLEYELIENPAGSDFNWIGIPNYRSDVENALDLYDLLNAQAGAPVLVRTLSRWNPVSQSFTQFVAQPFITGNFPVSIGEAYRVEVTRNHVWSLEGAEPEVDSLTYELRSTQSTSINYISLPWYKTDLVFASDLYDDINANVGSDVVESVQAWNAVAQAWVQYFPGNLGDFDVNQGQAYRIDVTATATYQPLQNQP